MIYQKLALPLTVLALLTSWSSRAWSGEQNLSRLPSLSLHQEIGANFLMAQTFQPPQGTPPNSTGGASRGNGTQSASIIPLTPRNENPNVRWGQTLSATPTFFLYVPAGIDKNIKFYLADESDGETLYETFVIPPTSGGIISVALPREGGKILKEGMMYRWSFEIQVNPTESSLNPSVGGFVERITPSQELSSQLRAATTDDDRSKIYAANGLWYDLVATAATLRSTNPTNWEAMLNSVGLGAIAQAPLITPPTTITNSNRNLPENRTAPN